MTTPKPLLPLTSTERRLAAIAYAANVGSADAAVRVVYRYRGEYGRPETVADGEAMLEELRRDPDSERDDRRVTALHEVIDGFWAVADAARYDGERNTTALSRWFARCHASHSDDRQTIGRYRDLLERIVREHDITPEGGVAWGMASAINDARKALEAGSR